MNTDTDRRVQREAEAYDEGEVLQRSIELQGRFWHVFKCPNTVFLDRYFDQASLTRVPGSVVLDYGCLVGESSYQLYQHGPQRMVGIDISEMGIAHAKQHYGKQVEFHVMDAHRTTFADNTFDLVVGRSILHHLDWETALQELRRILKPGGVAVFYEPLGDNPAAKLFRLLTPKARTLDEKPLSKSQIKSANRILGNAHHQYGNLVSVPVAMLTSLFLKNPNNRWLRVADAIDRQLAKTPVKHWMRSVVLVWEKTA